MLRRNVANSLVYRFGVPTLIMVVTLLLSWITTQIIDDTPLLFLMAGVVLSAWLCGLVSTIFSLAITFVGLYLIDPPSLGNQSILLQFIVLSLIAALIGYVEDRRKPSIQALHSEFDLNRQNVPAYVASKQLAAIVQNSDDAIIGKSLEGIIQSWNPGAEYLYGYSAEEAIGQHISLIFPEDIKTREIQLIERVLSGERIHHYETKRLTKYNHMIDISLTISPVRNNRGRLIGYATIERNITYRKRREADIYRLRAELLQRHQRLQTIISNIPGIVYTASGPDGSEQRQIDFISDYAETMLGYTVEQWLSVPNLWKQIIHPDDWENVVKATDFIHQSGKVGSVQFRCITKLGQTLYVESHTSIMHDENGEPVGTCGVVMDITERKQTRDQLMQVSMLLEALNQRFSNLVGNVPGIVYERTFDTASNEVQYNFISDYTETMLGYPADNWKTNPMFWRDIVPDEDRKVGIFDHDTMSNGIASGHKQFRSFDSSGHIHTLETYYHSVQEDDMIKSYGVITDISDRKRLEIAEREQREFAEALADISALLTSSLNLDDVFERILFSLHRVVPHDYASVTIVKNGDLHVIQRHNTEQPSASNKAFQQQIQAYDEVFANQMSQTGEPLIVDNLPQQIGSLIEPEFQAYLGVPIQLRNKIIGYVHLLSETANFFEHIHTERLNAFSRLAAIAIQNARLFDESQQLAALEERQRLARELHDSVSQTLFTCRTMSESAIRRWNKSPSRALELMKEVNQLTTIALAEMRILLLELRPSSLKHVNLKQLFEQYLRPIQERREFELTMAIDDMPPLPSDVKIALYRITQEALNNIDKHAQASNVDVRGTDDAEQIVIEIRDDGQGFVPSNVQATSLGLNIMRERAEEIGATLEISSEPQHGTQIRIRWRKDR